VQPETGIFASTARWRVDAEQSIMRKSELRSFIWRAEADDLLTAREAYARSAVVAYGLCMVRYKAVLERCAALRCLWHGVRVVGRSNR
jgi:hypothetical protein